MTGLSPQISRIFKVAAFDLSWVTKLGTIARIRQPSHSFFYKLMGGAHLVLQFNDIIIIMTHNNYELAQPWLLI